MNVTVKGNRAGAPTLLSLSTRLDRLYETARENPQYQFENIAHLISVELLEWSFQRLRKDAAAGVDGVTPEDYQKNLQSNLADLHKRLKEGRYQAQPLRRVYIGKDDGKQRPLSIPGLEDKICQKAVSELLTRIYENDFLPVSYGYRPGRGPHDALDAINRDITLGKANYVLDADISDYFGSIVRSQLMTMLQKRITDRHLLALIGKWLRVGVIEDGRLFLSENGTYQGSVISPILANVYLHEVLDLWVQNDVRSRLRGEMKLYRFADDLIATFEYQEDAEKFMRVLPKRFGKFGLTLHPDKTRLIEFGFRVWAKAKKGGSKPETFNFLGFTHFCGTTRKGKFSVKVKTMKKRLARGIQRVKMWCKRNRHLPLQEQHRHLRSVLLGHYAYYGRRNNSRFIVQFHYVVRRTWHKWVSRRGARSNWESFAKILERFPLPKPRLMQGALSRRSQLNWFEEFI